MTGQPSCKCLATSRETLGVGGETAWLVPSLALPALQHLPPLGELEQSAAVQLFVERAVATLPTFTLTQQNALDVAQICRRLDGIPLAIELAVTRIKVLSVDQLAARLDDCFRLLTAGSRTAMPRQQTLQATVDWSYDLLTEAERALFRRLAVFVGGWTLEAAESVCAWEGISVAEVLELLAHLVDKSLVVVEPQSYGAVRYRLLETIRTYALERLAASGELEAIRRHHAMYYLGLAETAEPELLAAQQRAWLERLAAELDNRRAVLAWSREGGPTNAEAGLSVAGALGQFWELRGSWTEGRTWLAEFLRVTETLRGTPARAKGLVAAGALAFHHGDYQAARSLCEEGLAICRTLQDQRGSAWALIYLGWMANDWGDYAAAHTFCMESLAICRELGDQQGIVRSLSILGLGAYFQGDFAGPQPLFEEALGIARQSNDRWGVAWSLRHLGMVLAAAANYAAAQQLQEESLLIWRELGDKRNIAWELWGLGVLAFAQRDYTAALARYQEGLSISVELGSKFGMMLMLIGFAGLAAGQAQPERAVRLAGAAGALRETIGVSIPPFFLGQLERWLAPARQVLSEQACAAAEAAGRALSLEQAIAEVVANGA